MAGLEKGSGQFQKVAIGNGKFLGYAQKIQAPGRREQSEYR